MADTTGQADIRGIDVQKLLVGYGVNIIQLKQFCRQSTTKAREIRWFQKTPGILTSTTTTGMTTSMLNGMPELARPTIVGPSFIRQTSYVDTFMVESETISEQDIKDSDVDVLGVTIADLAEAVAQKVNVRIWDVLSNGRTTTPLNTNACAAAWDTASFTGVTMVEDVTEGEENLRASGYNPDNAVLLLDSLRTRKLKEWLIETKGANVVMFSSNLAEKGKLVEFLGHRVVTDINVTDNYGALFIPNKAVAWKTFTPLQSVVITDPMIGKKVRVQEEGQCLLEHPKAVNLFTGM